MIISRGEGVYLAKNIIRYGIFKIEVNACILIYFAIIDFYGESL